MKLLLAVIIETENAHKRRGEVFMKKRMFSAILCVIMVVTMMSGCGSSGGTETTKGTEGTTTGGDTTQGSSDDKPYAGTTVSVLCASTPYIETLRANISEFEEATGITVEFDQYENEQLSNQIAVNAAAGGTELDVVLYRPIQENLSFISKGWLENLDSYIETAGDEYDYMDYTDSAREITSKDGSAYGIPLVTERGIIQYNTEMLAEVGYDSIPETYDEFVELCEKLKEAGYTPIGLRGEGNAAVTQFSSFLYGFGGDFIDLETGKALINTDEFVEALQFYGMLCAEYSPDGVLNAGWEETSNWFTQEQVAMRADCDSQYSYALDENNSLVYDKVGYGVIPGETADSRSPFSIVAWSMGISSGSKNKEASWEFIKWATSKEMDLLAQQEGNFSARNSTWADESSTENVPAGLIEVIETSNAIAVPYDRPYMQNSAEARTAIGELITKAIEGATEDELRAACEDVNTTVQTLLDSENAQ